MSYILDALKKAEQARGRGKAPDLFAVQSDDTPIARRPVWPWVVAGLLVVNAAALSYWFQRRPAAASALPPELSPPQSKVLPTAPVVASASPPVTIDLPARRPVQETRVPRATKPATASPVYPKAAPKKPDAPRPADKLIAKTEVMTPPAQTAPMNSPPLAAAENAASPTSAETARDTRVLRLAELPVDVQQEVPRMAVSLHMYSGKPANRLVNVNDKTMHEGEELIPGLKLLEITPDGMVFSYKTYTFRKAIN